MLFCRTFGNSEADLSRATKWTCEKSYLGTEGHKAKLRSCLIFKHLSPKWSWFSLLQDFGIQASTLFKFVLYNLWYFPLVYKSSYGKFLCVGFQHRSLHVTPFTDCPSKNNFCARLRDHRNVRYLVSNELVRVYVAQPHWRISCCTGSRNKRQCSGASGGDAARRDSLWNFSHKCRIWKEILYSAKVVNSFSEVNLCFFLPAIKQKQLSSNEIKDIWLRNQSFLHLKFFIPRWILLWLFRWNEWANFFPHVVHSCLFSPVQ